MFRTSLLPFYENGIKLTGNAAATSLKIIKENPQTGDKAMD